MKRYFSIVVRNSELEVMKMNGNNRKEVEYNLRQNGFKIYKTLSEELYNYYVSVEPYKFFEKYLKNSNDETCLKLRSLMWNEWVLLK